MSMSMNVYTPHTQKMGTMTHADKRKIKKADNARAGI